MELHRNGAAAMALARLRGNATKLATNVIVQRQLFEQAAAAAGAAAAN